MAKYCWLFGDDKCASSSIVLPTVIMLLLELGSVGGLRQSHDQTCSQLWKVRMSHVAKKVMNEDAHVMGGAVG